MHPLALLLLTASAGAQILNAGIPNVALPGCGDTCTQLTAGQSACGDSWECFCKNVWAASGEDLTTLCTTSCTDPTDQAEVQQWYTANCGQDNGATEHPPGSTTTTGAPGTTTTNSAASNTASTSDSSSSSGGCSGSWWHCHYQWVVAIIVIAIVLIIAGFGGRYWKKQHDRKKEAKKQAYNAGIADFVGAGGAPGSSGEMVERSSSCYDDKPGPGDPTTFNTAQYPYAPAAAHHDRGDISDPAAAYRGESFNPYGYGFRTSDDERRTPDDQELERGHGRVSPIGGTPFEQIGESGAPASGGNGVRDKMRRVMVRERSVR